MDIRNNTFTEFANGYGATPYPIIYLPNESLLNKADNEVNYVRGNTFNNSTESGAQYYAVYWDGKTTDNSASNLLIEDNHFDGYTKAGVYLKETGAVTVRRNTFGAKMTAGVQGEAEETSSTTGLVVNADTSANRKINTWYPDTGSVEKKDCELWVTLTAPVDAKPTVPVTIDFYYTANKTAEVYLGSVENVGKSPVGGGTMTQQQVIVPNLPTVSGGYIRVQTQSDNAGQPESSQYSRAEKIPTLGTCLEPKVEIELQAWRNVGPPTAATYESIMEGSVAVEIPEGGRLASGSDVWFTYTAKNTGHVPLKNVVITDSLGGDVCEIPLIPKQDKAGCAKRYTAL